MLFYAHRRENPDGGIVRQTVFEHLSGTALRAGQCLKSAGLEHTGYLAGLLHDMGKYSDEFQEYLESGGSGRRGSVIHTFQGCRYMMKKFHNSADVYQVMTSELLAFAIGAHHGLFDCVDAAQKIGLRYREEKQDVPYEVCLERFFNDVPETEIERLFAKSAGEIERVVGRISEAYTADSEYNFENGLLARFILSAVIEADRYDTAAFMSGSGAYIWRDDMSSVWAKRLDHMEKMLARFPCGTPVEKARHTISDTCRRFAAHGSGIYRLNVPTGSGKTLASLRYALSHAMQFNKKRLFFVSPLLSILEQNAAVIREFVGDDRLILEHHSNVVRTESERDELDERELLIQSWDSPIVITTLVQLLNTLFDGKTASIRRFHALCGSVIIIDEVQTVPAKMLTLFNLAIQFLSEQCGAAVILCSATQPALEGAEHPLKAKPEDMVTKDEAVWAAFRRTEICAIPPHRLDELPEVIRAKMDTADSLLVVCNRKDEAAFLLKNTESPEYKSFHLSAAMCMQHRRDVLAALREALARREKVLCVATQVIEAGVDISFDSVLRLAAGMDSVVQTAGRCNRGGEANDLRPVYVVNCSDEKLGMLKDIRRGKEATLELMDAFQRAPEKFENDLFSDESVQYYYRALYRGMEKGEQDYSVREGATLFDLMGTNEKYADGRCKGLDSFFLRQAFKTAGALFSVFDEDTTDVLVPYGKGRELIEELCSQQCRFDMGYRASVLNKMNGYTVGVYEYQRKRLEQAHALVSACDDCVFVLADGFYNETVGLSEDMQVQAFMEV